LPQPGEDAGEAAASPPSTVAPPPTVPPSDVVVPPTEFEPAFTPLAGTVPTPPTALYALIGTTLVLLVVVGTPEVVRRWRRRHPDPDPSVQLNHLWMRALGAVEATGFRIDPSLTPIEQARAASPRLPVAARPLKSLAELTTQAVFSPAKDVGELEIPTRFAQGGPRRWCRQVERIAADSMTAPGRIKRYFTVWR